MTIPTLHATSITFQRISGLTRVEESSTLPVLPQGRQLNVHTDPDTRDDVNRILIGFDQPFKRDGIVADGRPQAAHLDGPIDGGSIAHIRSDLAAAGSQIVQLTMKNPSSFTIPGTYRLTVFGRAAAGIVPLVAANGDALNGDFLRTPGGSDLVVTFRVNPPATTHKRD